MGTLEGATGESTDASARAYDEIIELLGERDPEVHAGKMFGMPTFMRGRKAFGGLTHGDLVFKLTGPQHAEALALAGAALFDPGDLGRPMKQWVVIPAAHRKTWPAFAQAALNDLRNA
jgi:hypothetical protein